MTRAKSAPLTSTTNALDSVVCSPNNMCGGVKSLYSVCGWLGRLGRSTVASDTGMSLASWFRHECQPYDYSYVPSALIYPEIVQPWFEGVKYHICFALGRHGRIGPRTDIVVCKSPSIVSWVREQNITAPAILIAPSIDRSVFEYDGRPKRSTICYMPRPGKHPNMAKMLRDRYGDRVVELVDRPEWEVAETLKDAKVFVWRGNTKDGSPRPPKEALVAGCVVVGLAAELNSEYMVDFGLKCSSDEEILAVAGDALEMPVPSREERSVVRDKDDEMADWLAVIGELVD